MKRLRKNRFERRGSAVVEMAVMAPLAVTAMLGMMEVATGFMIKQTVTLASREGARAASLPGGDLADAQGAVDAAMSAADLEGYTMESNVSELGPNDLDVWVEVSIPLDRVSFTGNLLGGGSFDITSRTTMRREGVDASESEGVED